MEELDQSVFMRVVRLLIENDCINREFNSENIMKGKRTEV